MRFWAILFVLMFFVGCSGDSGQEADKGKVASSANSAPLDKKSEIEKWNSYVDLGNSIDTSFYQAMNAYFEAFGNRQNYIQGAQGEDIDSFVAAMPAPDELAKAIDQAIVMSYKEPKSELDLAVGEICIHMKELWSGLIASRDHHAGRQHLLEDDTTAANLHAQIYEAYQGLSATYDHFRGTLNKADATRRKTDLKAMLSQGLVIRPAMLKLLDSAQALQDHLNSRSITSDTLSNLNLITFELLYNNFVKSFQEYENVMGDLAALKKENLKAAVVEAFSKQAAQVRASADKLVERRRSDDAAVDDSSPLQEGAPEQFAAVLGNLVDFYNTALNQ